MSKTAEKPLQAARERFTRIAEEVKDRYDKVAHEVEEHAGKASAELKRGAEVARKRYEEANAKLHETYDRTQERAEKWKGEIVDYVQEYPGRAIAIAAAAGFVIGVLFRRRS